MKNYFLKIILTILIVALTAQDALLQEITNRKITNLNFSKQLIYSTDFLKKSETASPTLPLAIGITSVFYIFNPIILFENNKINIGLTKEISLGFGYFGEYRAGFEYSLIFRENKKNHIRLSFKYDNLLKDIEPSNMLQGTFVLSLGGGYFTDFDGHGFFPELSYGYSIRNDKILFYPHVKIRYTIMTNRNKFNITDFSFGIIFGIANPFIDLKIRKKH